MTANSRPERVLLISDLHLSESAPGLTGAFEDFLTREAPHCRALYILGDLFDAWIGDDDDRPLNARVASALRRQADQGLDIFLMHGNRDFLLGRDFAARAGASLLDDPYLLTCFGNHYLLSHGDSLCTRDADYQAFRQQVRDPAWQREFLARPLAERRAFAERARTTSRDSNSSKADDIMDVTPDEVQRMLREAGCPVLLHGHTHRPAIHHLDVDGRACKRMVLGDWGESGWCIAITAAGEELLRFATGRHSPHTAASGQERK